jgi:hypothetical protein
MRPSLFNPPLPRMKPQPLSLTMIIAKRRRVGERRLEKIEVLKGLLEDLRIERVFEDGVAKLVQGQYHFDRLYTRENSDEWSKFHILLSLSSFVDNVHFSPARPLHQTLSDIYKGLAKAQARVKMPYPPEMLARIKEARRQKIANKTRELERERRGEVLRRTIRRRNKGPPAPVLTLMSEREKHLDKISRSSVSEVGYVGLVKRKLGFKLRDPELWKAEGGWEEDKARVDAMMRDIEKENERRRRKEAETKEPRGRRTL